MRIFGFILLIAGILAQSAAAQPAAKALQIYYVDTEGGQSTLFVTPSGESLLVDAGKQEATLYVLGEDEKTPAPISAEKLDLHLKAPAVQVELKPQPLDGESAGKVSRFVGKHEQLGKGPKLEGTVLGVIDGKPSQGEFKEEPKPKK